MKAPLWAGVFIACAAGAWFPDGQQVFRSGTQVVFVDVSVMTGRTPVVDLGIRDFSLADNGVQQQLETVAAASVPLDVTLVVDTTFTGVLYGIGANAANESDVQRSVSRMAGALGATDRLRVLGFDADVIERRSMSPVESTLEPMSVRPSRIFANRSAVTNALLTALTSPVASDRRHIVVLFALGSGKPTVAPMDQLVSVARRADALLYAVLPPIHHEQITNRVFPFYPSERVIREAATAAAEATGGRALFTGEIEGAFRDILKEFRRSYMLRYTLQGVPSAGWHDIVVRVPRCPTCTVQSRHGYLGR